MNYVGLESGGPFFFYMRNFTNSRKLARFPLLGTRHYFLLVEWVLDPITQLLLPPINKCNLLNLNGYPAMLVIILIHWCCS